MNGKQHVSALTTQLRVEYTHTQMIVCLRSVGFVHAKGTAPAKFQHLIALSHTKATNIK